MKKPKIAIAHEFFTILGGAEKVLVQIHHAFPEADIFFLLSDQKLIDQYLPRAKVTSSYLNIFPSFLTKRHQLFLFQFPIAVEQFDFSDYDIVITSCNSFIKGIITKPDTIHICYNHSPTRYIWDQAADWVKMKNLELFNPIIQWRFNKLRQWDLMAADRVDMYIANSSYVAKRIEKYYRRSVSKVIYPTVDTKQFVPKKINKKNYFVIISRLEPYKRFDLVVEAFNQLKIPLYIAGTGSHEKYLKSIAKDNIKFLGFVSDEKVIDLFQEARAFVFPTEEDFGIVPIESMAAGTPVLAYQQGGVQESVIKNKTGLFFKQQNVESIVSTVKEFIKKESQITSQNCLERARDFDHSVFIKEIRKVADYAYQNKNEVLLKAIEDKKSQ